MTEFSMVEVKSIKLNSRNARTHSKRQVRQIADSISQFGFVNPIIVDEGSVAIAGHGRVAAAHLLNISEVPVIVVRGLSEPQKRLLMLADNKIAANAGWDREKLALEINELSLELEGEGLNISLSGFEVPEIDLLMDDFTDGAEPDEPEVETPTRVVVQQGDVWKLGPHRLMCGNARSREDLDRLMAGNVASMVFIDPPYNVSIKSVVGRGSIQHREFAEASGEQSQAEFVAFLGEALDNVARVSREGSLHYVCMDWRHVGELIAAAKIVYAAHINTAIWTKTNAGQGSFYRSQHEEILVFRKGSAAHLNNVELGRHGRSRSNVWSYPGSNTFRAGRLSDLRAHPTVKPIALVADAIKDCTRRGDIVLDTFVGSGTTILAAERTGRRALAMEIDPVYAETAIRRWQVMTGKDAVLESSGETLDDLSLKSTNLNRSAATHTNAEVGNV